MRFMPPFGLCAVLMLPMAAYGQRSDGVEAIRVNATTDPVPILVEVKENDSQETIAWKYLQATKGIKSREDLKNKSIADLKEAGKLPYERVEVNGVSTTRSGRGCPGANPPSYRVPVSGIKVSIDAGPTPRLSRKARFRISRSTRGVRAEEPSRSRPPAA
jgi:hypothetical protein